MESLALILKKFPNAECVTFSDFMGNAIVIFTCNYYRIEIAQLDGEYLVSMRELDTRDGTSKNAATVDLVVEAINDVFLNGL